ncbi:ribosomal RNA assembly protein mis3 [Reticulomyxa filosa]|uniref:Ribosomal RNA assembly protein mis3 n=1 Tax=Reticulomyxa filosa TaxID=46433 RepID=X6NGG2_RETFI|nr:ribosomal RNA assembly protein mis3 [Reticulomyxa filosa]|eukprot:ETO24988.1 ribosomal RNA assembly protein mis3 [Reticulomyxa filosa]
MDCMANIHPIYQLKRLMVLRELQSRSDVKDENWARYLPTFKKLPRTSYGQNKLKDDQRRRTLQQIRKTKRKMQQKNQRRYTPWPPPPVPSKVDIALETGEYWDDEWKKQNLAGTKRQRELIAQEKREHLELQNQKKQQTQVKKEEKIAKIKKMMDAPEETGRFNDKQTWNDRNQGGNRVDEIKNVFKQHNKKISDQTESNFKNFCCNFCIVKLKLSKTGQGKEKCLHFTLTKEFIKKKTSIRKAFNFGKKNNFVFKTVNYNLKIDIIFKKFKKEIQSLLIKKKSNLCLLKRIEDTLSKDKKIQVTKTYDCSARIETFNSTFSQKEKAGPQKGHRCM